MKSVAREKNGKIEIRKRPTETKIFLIYPDCRDCIHWKKCGKKWKNLKIDTNLLAQECEEYEKDKTKNGYQDRPDWKTHPDQETPRISHIHS